MILVRASGAGIKREGLLYFEKYGTGGPEFGIKEEFVTERGKLERRENFLLQGRLSVLTLISVSVPPPCYHSST